jgi:predicted RNA binding protein YcfA (HicA-like mRNA interferase family)
MLAGRFDALGFSVFALSRLPSVRPDRLVRALVRVGFEINRQRGSHVVLVHPDGRRAVVPMHASRDVPRGLLASILADVNMTGDELRALL